MEHLHNEVKIEIPENLKELVEARKRENGTYKTATDEPATIAKKVASVPIKPDDKPQPVLCDELTRLRNRISYLEGMVDGMKFVLDHQVAR